jgi:hypothetical protein
MPYLPCDLPARVSAVPLPINVLRLWNWEPREFPCVSRSTEDKGGQEREESTPHALVFKISRRLYVCDVTQWLPEPVVESLLQLGCTA